MIKTLVATLISFCIIIIPDSHFVGPHAIIQITSFLTGEINLFSTSAFLGTLGFITILLLNKTNLMTIIMIVLSEILMIISLFKFFQWHDWFIPFGTGVPFFICCIISWYKLWTLKKNK